MPSTVLQDDRTVKLVTDEGSCMGICIRDDTFEFSIFKEGVEPKHFIVDYYNMEIKRS